MSVREVPLKHVARLKVSNVDKKAVEGQRSVRLCNYVDVYKNDSIHLSLDLMSATATEDQVRQFRLLPGDTVITKDSETAEDIAVPAYVAESAADLVCGYHLAIVRPGADLHPRFLFWAMSSNLLRGQMTAAATGVTRYGLRQEAMGSAVIAVPDLDEQRRIADFLDGETARMDRLIQLRAQTAALAVERHRGHADGMFDQLLQRNAVTPLKYLTSVTVGIVVTPSLWYVESNGVPALRGLNVQAGKVVTEDLIEISEAGHRHNSKSRLRAQDVVVVRTGQAGAAAVVPAQLDGANCIDLLIVRQSPVILSGLLEHFLNSATATRAVAEESVGSIQAHYNVGALKRLLVPVPHIREQRRVLDDLDTQRTVRDTSSTAQQRQIDLLVERRRALITDAVSGQLDATTARGAA